MQTRRMLLAGLALGSMAIGGGIALTQPGLCASSGPPIPTNTNEGGVSVLANAGPGQPNYWTPSSSIGATLGRLMPIEAGVMQFYWALDNDGGSPPYQPNLGLTGG